ncbi:MAG: hypothetical protein WA637_07410 [Terriglobales bacterium]
MRALYAMFLVCACALSAAAEDPVDAYEYLESNVQVGKVVVTVA